jgi:glycosyltransferase involved in cell wall biosynthesis
MKLVYATRQYPELTETFVTEELRQLVELGHSVQVFAPYPGNGTLDGAPAARYFLDDSRSDRIRDLGGLLLHRPLGALRAISDPRRRLGASALEMAVLAPLARAAGRADHVHAHFATEPATRAAQLSALAGTPFSFTAHAYDIFLRPDRLEEKLARCRLAVTISDYNRRYLAGKWPQHAHKVHVVRYGVDVEHFRRRTPYDPGGPVVAIGRLVPKKGFGDLVRAAAAAGPDAIPEVWIAGDGPLRQELEALIAELRAPVQLLGAKNHEEVRELYEQASALALPCVVAPDGDRDGMPLVIKEAMAMELPFVGTREVAIPEEIGPDRGILVDPGDWEALGEALRSLYAQTSEQRAEMGRAARRYTVEHFDLRRRTERLVDLFAT